MEPTPPPKGIIVKRLLLLIPVLLILAAAAKRRKMIRHFEGDTPAEARERIITFVTHRTGDAAKAEHVADRLVPRLEARGVLVPESAAS